MPAKLVPNEAIPELAAQIDSATMLRVLRRLKQRGFLQNGAAVDADTAAALKRLAELGLVDPGYAGPTEGEPFIWVSNHNGERVLKHIETTVAPRVKVNPLAHTALNSLSEAEREAVQSALDWLLLRDPVLWPRELAERLRPEVPEYLLRVTPDLRAFVTVLPATGVELVDIMRTETLRRFLESTRAGGKVG
ncbi:MAG TPA: hypothetical protein VEL76_00015 [Gemmataceae bacterium]|nr:hypothetical protein [Gemmataceae bacterium]